MAASTNRAPSKAMVEVRMDYSFDHTGEADQRIEQIHNGWFTETWPGLSFSLRIEDILYHKKSAFQDILVFNSATYGRVLVLDGNVQCTQKDECAYQEMISFLPLTCHPNPEKVLILGGGDGGVAREVAKHPAVKSVTLCEIDEDVITVSKSFLPTLAKGFEDPKLTVHIGDGKIFLQEHLDQFDVIITDASDPIASTKELVPAKSLFDESFYYAAKMALKDDGILCCQAESIWMDLDSIVWMYGHCKLLFKTVAYASISIPSYLSGYIGFLLASKNPKTNFNKPLMTDDEMKSFGCRFYNTGIHVAATTMPEFAADEFRDVDESTKFLTECSDDEDE